MPRKLGIFGGSFDPPHLGHLIAAQSAWEQLGLDAVLFVPAGSAYHKAEGLAASHRLEMTRRAIAHDERFIVSTVDVDRAGPSYTIDTLAALREEYPGAEFTLLLGSDAYLGLDDWHRAAELRSQLAIAVVSREPGAIASSDGAVRYVSIDPIGISSTQCRERIRHGLGVKYFVPDAVANYIDELKLYRGDDRD